jgi:hypothetical protein
MSSSGVSGNFILTKVNDPLSQGDILKDCQYLVIPDDLELKEDGAHNFDIDIYERVIVMSNSCDLDQEKIGLVLLCPVYELHAYCEKLIPGEFINLGEKKKFMDKIRNFKREIFENAREGYFLLGECGIEEPATEPLFIDFGNAYSLPLTYIKSFVKSDSVNRKRPQVIDPVRRELLAKFGEFYMRENEPRR